MVSIFTITGYLHASTIQKDKQKKPPILKEEMNRMKKGGMSKIEKLKIAERFLRHGDENSAKVLYEENIGKINTLDYKTLFNYGTVFLKRGDLGRALKLYDNAKKKAKGHEKNVIKDNIRKIGFYA